MTTYSSFFSLSGIEILAYRNLLQLWHRYVVDQTENQVRSIASLEKRHLLNKISSLIEATYTADGLDASTLTDTIRDHYLASLQSAISSSATTFKGGMENADYSRLIEVVRKITKLNLSSTRHS